jgi:small conductance mechanosensitive channel
MDLANLGTYLQEQGVNLLRGLLVLAAGFFLVSWVLKFSKNRLHKIRIEPTLESFLNNLIRLVLYLLVILTAVNVMGIPLTSILTIVASAGVAVSLALQGALSNLVGGVILLLLKPIKVGEYVKITDANGTIEGTVVAIGAFYTELSMPDRRHLSVPNRSLTDTPIFNFTREGTRRLDVTFPISYDADIDHVFQVLTDLAGSHPAVFRDPAPVVHLSGYGDSSITYLVRIWCKTEDYWDINYYLLEEGRRALDKAGIGIPYPQMDIHMK